MKNLFNTTKKKVIAGVTSFALIAGGGVALADTDAAAQIKMWYDSQFNKSAQQVNGDYEKHRDAEFAKTKEAVDGMKNSANNQIDVAKQAELHLGKRDIDKAKNKNIDDVKAATQDVMKSMDFQFDELFKEGQKTLNDISKSAQQQYNREIGLSVGTAQGKALNQVDTELEDLTDKAIKDLEDVIAASKAEITKKLDSKSIETTSKLKDAVNQNTKNIQTSVQKIADQLVMDSKIKIQDKRKEKVNAAKSALDKVLSDYNK